MEILSEVIFVNLIIYIIIKSLYIMFKLKLNRIDVVYVKILKNKYLLKLHVRIMYV